MIVLLDGAPAEPGWREAANASAFTHGWAVFETLRGQDGRPRFLARHLERLARGAHLLGLELPPLAALEQSIRAAAAAAPRARIRLTLFADAPPIPPASAARTRWIVTGGAAGAHDGRPLALAVASVRRDERSPLSRIKCANYAVSVFARREAAAAGADDALLLNNAGRAAECTTSNVFAVCGGSLVTPPEAEGALSGVARAAVFDLAPSFGRDAEERPLALEDLARAEEVFVTSAVAGVRAVSRIQGAGAWPAPGPVTRAIDEAFEALPG